MAGKIEIKKSKSGKFHFNLKARNGQVILSSQMYKSKESATKGGESVKKNADNDARFERKESKNGEPYFVLKAGNGEVLGKSEMYSAKTACEKGIQSVMKNGPEADIVDLTEAD